MPQAAAAHVTFKGRLRTGETRQTEAVARTLASLRERHGGILSLPPGYGKTTVALAVAAQLGVRTAIVVHKQFLMDQWRDRIRQFCGDECRVGRVQQDACEVTGCDFVLVMLQTLSQRDFPPGALDGIGLKIVDECHHIGSRVFSTGMFALPTRYSLGLSATPDRKDGLWQLVEWHLGPMCFQVRRTCASNVAVDVVPYTCERYRDPPPITRTGGVAMAAMITEVTRDPVRTRRVCEVIRDAVEREKRKVLVLTDRRDHCALLCTMIGGAAAPYVGGMSAAELQESARADVIVATFTMAAEGLDIPDRDCLVLASPKSDVRQAVGRILRGGSGGDRRIVDVVDQWSVFIAQARKRSATYRAEGFDVKKKEEEEVRFRRT